MCRIIGEIAGALYFLIVAPFAIIFLELSD